MSASKIEMRLRRREYHRVFNKGKKYKKQRRVATNIRKIDSYYANCAQANK